MRFKARNSRCHVDVDVTPAQQQPTYGQLSARGKGLVYYDSTQERGLVVLPSK